MENLLSMGLDHHFGEDTKAYGFFTTGEIGGTSARNEYVAVGIQHNF